MALQVALPDAGKDHTNAITTQVRIHLSTPSPDIALSQDPGPILVKTNFRRYALSTLVNTLLQSTESIPFDFLINGQFLRTSLDEYLTANGISAETTLSVEYVHAILPPLYATSFEHEDWVSSVDILSKIRPGQTLPKLEKGGESIDGRILSGSYDGRVRLWSTSSQLLSTSMRPDVGGQILSVKAVKFLGPHQVASAGLDRTIKLWKISQNETESIASMSLKMELYGHRGGIDSIDVHEQSQRVLSASADHSVGLWSTKRSEASPAPPSLLPSSKIGGSKRRKVGPASSVPQCGPLSLLNSHSAPASSAMFAPNDHTVAYSVSWDHSLKTWDLPTSTCVDTRSTSHALLSLASLQSLSLLAAGTSARHITLIDPRAGATIISAMTLRGHTNAVVSLAPNPESPYGLLSGSHDGTCRIWDVRSSKSDRDGRVGESIYCIERESAKGGGKRTAGEGIKVFGVCWDETVGIVSAGEDRRLQLNRGKNLG